jgi:hypothetical protein
MTDPREARGRVYIAWIDDPPPPWATDGWTPQPGYYGLSMQGSPANPDIYEVGDDTPDIAVALAWARDRSEWIVIRPEWDPGRYYWAGTGVPPDDGRTELSVLPSDPTR